MPQFKLSDLEIVEPIAYGDRVYHPNSEKDLADFRESIRTADIPGVLATRAVRLATGDDPQRDRASFLRLERSALEELVQGKALAVVGTGDEGAVRRVDLVEALLVAGVRPPAPADSAPAQPSPNAQASPNASAQAASAGTSAASGKRRETPEPTPTA